TGDGRCNLLNDDLRDVYYNTEARGLVNSIYAIFGKQQILDFFRSLGLEMYSKEGRIFPITNQAASVVKVLEMELKRLAIPVEYGFNCSDISFSKDGILVSSKSGKTLEYQKVIVTGGGKTYPAFGSDGSMYEVARQLGHSIIEPVPSAVPLVVKDSLCQLLQGQRIFAGAKSLIEDKEGEEVKGDLIFAKYGLSGTCILDISETISVAMNRHKKTEVFVSVDMVPFMGRDQLRNELDRRRKGKLPAEDVLAGILPNKFCVALKDIFKTTDIATAVNLLKDRRFKVMGTRGWNEAEFTSGGVNVDEVNARTLESKLKKGVYFAGEVLDVSGRRGGYNLGWAWASGFVAGQTK
ncbi:MAG: hypothetical protein A2Y59_01485, partial [Chloroflexi bacterium RBG_13_52_14]